MDTHTRTPEPMGLGTNVLNAAPNVEKDVLVSAADHNLASEKDGALISIKGDNESNLDIIDPYHPFPKDPGAPDEDHILTIRAVTVGLLCGAAVNASNVYLGELWRTYPFRQHTNMNTGLKTGWTFSANLFGAIVGFAVLRFCSITFAEHIPILGGKFGPKENNIVQTAATSAGGLSGIFVSAIPAMYQLGLLKDPQADFWRIVSFTAVCAYFGFFFATPRTLSLYCGYLRWLQLTVRKVRKFFIIYVARELCLVFPTGTATAMTIRSMHAAVGGAQAAKKKTKALAYAFGGAFVLRVVSQYATGILWDWHFFSWFYIWGNYQNLAIHVENWGWYLEFTPAFIGSGMLVGLNPAYSFFGGSVLAWGIIGPALVHNGAAHGVAIGEGVWSEYTSFASFNLKDPKNAPSPRYWLLWPGVLTMIVVSFTELLCQYKMFWFAGRAVAKGTASGFYAMFKAAGKEIPWLAAKSHLNRSHLVEDPATDAEQVKWWMWLPGLVGVIVLTCVVLGVQYQMPVGMSLLSVVLGFLFSFLAIQCTGVTDITPLTAASKASQIVLGGATNGENWGFPKAALLNLLGGAIASGSANQSTDLTVDFRVGFLLRTPPKLQWIAQGIGCIVVIFLAPAMFVLFSKAYPCIIDLSAETCAFAAPSVGAWRAVAIAVTDPTFPIPNSSGIFSIAFAAFSALVVLFRIFYLTGRREKYRNYVSMPLFATIFQARQEQPLNCYCGRSQT